MMLAKHVEMFLAALEPVRGNRSRDIDDIESYRVAPSHVADLREALAKELEK